MIHVSNENIYLIGRRDFVENYFIGFIILLAIVYIMSTIGKLEERVKGMQYSLQQISKQVGVTTEAIDNEVRDLLAAGKDVAAVKRVRETLGLTLVEAKNYVDQLK